MENSHGPGRERAASAGEAGPGPDFVCIGAQKAGTTWLHETLNRHRDVWMPPVKEIHFFNAVCAHEELVGVESGKRPSGFDRLGPLLRRPTWTTARWLHRFYWKLPNTEWYYSLFDPELTGSRRVGDITPAYSTLDERGVSFARRVLRDGCKIVLVLRNPVERFWSSIKMYYRRMGSTIDDGELDRVVALARHPGHRLRGNYPAMLRLWRDYFGDDFEVFLYDTLCEDPGRFLEDVFAHLELSPGGLESTVEGRANADPHRRQMPERVRRELLRMYEEEILEVERFVEGVAERWLENGRPFA